MRKPERGTVADVGNAANAGPLKLDVLVAYEDFGAGLRVRQALDQTVQGLAVEADLHVNLWKFDLLREPAVYQQALNEAGGADIVFVSAHGRDPLPLSVRSWLQQWLEHKRCEPCALVVSLDADAGNTPIGMEMLKALRVAARPAGVDVFLHLAEGKAHTEWESVREDLKRREVTTTTLLDEILHQVERKPNRHWGINE